MRNVRSLPLYGLESWTLQINTITAVEVWYYHAMLKVSYADCISNADVLRRIISERELFKRSKKRKTAYFGHMLRGE